MKFYLIVASGKKKGMPIPITVDLFMLGSEKMCQLRSDRVGVGPKHCALVNREHKVFVRDMNCGEPTMLNGTMIPPGDEWPCHAGDILDVGPLKFVFQLREKPLSQRDLEEWALRCLDVEAEREIPEEEDFRGVRKRIDTPANAAASILDMLSAKRGTVKGRLRIGHDGDITLVRFNDVYLVEEAEIALLRSELYENLNHANLRVLLDLKNVRRLSTTAVAMIDELCGWLKNWGSTLAMCRVRPELKDILPQLSLNNEIPYFHDKRTAMMSKW
jgi:anti-anti-sigma regulatory factor